AGQTWSTQLNQPTAEFYRVTVDNQFPYRVYGAQKDNSTISVPSWPPGGITPEETWFDVGGGESGHIAVDPTDPDIIYAGNYIGQITRFDRKRWHMRDVVAYPQMHDGVAPRDIVYRFQWNAPIRISPHDPKILYHTSQHVHRSTDEGQSWEVISPDLTTNKDEYHDIPGGPVQHDHTGVELFTTIFSFEESPLDAGELWAGSDDGLVHISIDNGKNWQNITPPDMPEEGTVNTIDLSTHSPGRAILSVYRYRRADFRPYIFLTNDHGKSWTSLTDGRNGIPEDHFVRVVREDPQKKGLLYAGTEFGMYISFDEGQHWQKFQLNLPITPITDLAVHQNDLVVGTQGRSFWILDDLTPLHQLTAEIEKSAAYLFKPRLAYRTQLSGYRGDFTPDSPDRGATVFYFLQESPEQEVILEFQDAEGELIRSFSSKASKGETIKTEPGMNRWVWDLRYPKPELVDGAVMSLSRNSGTPAPPGRYRVKMSVGDWSQTQSFEIVRDPRWSVSDDDLRAQFDLASDVGASLTQAHDAIRRIRSIRSQTAEIADRAVESGYDHSIQSSAEDLAKELTRIEDELIQTKSESGQDPINYPPRLDNQFAYLHSIVVRQDARPTAGAYQRLADLKEELGAHLKDLEGVLENELKRFNQLLEQEGVPRIIQPGQSE
ncbi:MAG: glycosyl hydrolase, partial [Acidobacteriota bacterium]